MKNISNNVEKMKWLYSYSAWILFLWNLSLLLSKLRLTSKKNLYGMDKSGYDFRIQCAEIDKDIKYFKQWNHCRPVLLMTINDTSLRNCFENSERYLDEVRSLWWYGRLNNIIMRYWFYLYFNVVLCSRIFRCTLTKIPETNSLLQKSRLPLGILIHPFKDLNVSILL
jgi:hypothetical protein